LTNTPSSNPSPHFRQIGRRGLRSVARLELISLGSISTPRGDRAMRKLQSPVTLPNHHAQFSGFRPSIPATCDAST
jgi:hypothetical protein